MIAELAPGAVMDFGGGGGIAGETTHLTVFADGRVERARRPTPVRVPVARIEKLASDLAETGVFAQKDGRWKPPRPVPDGFGYRIVVRDKVGTLHAYEWSTGEAAPDAVVRAVRVGQRSRRKSSAKIPSRRASAWPAIHSARVSAGMRGVAGRP